MELKCEGLYKSFGQQVVLDNAAVTFERGKVFFLMAPNGYGKTTFLKLLSHLLKVDEGIIKNPFLSGDMFTIFDDLSLYKNLSGLANIQLFTNFKVSKEGKLIVYNSLCK